MAQNIDYGNRNTFSALTGKLYAKVVRRSEIKTVALTGSYNDLADKPSIPNGNLYVKKAGDTISGNVVPTSDGNVILGSAANAFGGVYSKAFMIDRRGKQYSSVFVLAEGTSSVQGEVILSLGNEIVSGTEGNSRGRLRMFGTGSGRTDLFSGNDSANNIVLTLPSTGGTLALTSQIPTVPGPATVSANGLMSAADKSKLDGITASADSVSFSRSLTSGTKVGTITINGTGTDLYAPTNTDTHHTAKNIVGPSATATANDAATNGNVRMNLIENGAVRSSHVIKGTGATSVTSDANGVITVNSANTTYGVATTSANGLMSSSDKSKLDAVANTYVKKAGDTLTGILQPNTDGTVDFGTPSHPFLHVYARFVNLFHDGKQYGRFHVNAFGTDSAVGESILVLGNGIVSGTAGNANGRLVLYGTGTGYTSLIPGNDSANNIVLTLPSAGGTLARTVDNVASATQVHVTNDAPSSETSYYVPFHASALSENKSLLTNDGIRYNTLNGSASAKGFGLLILGNGTSSGTAGNKYGVFRLFGSDSHSWVVSGDKPAGGDYTLRLPKSNGCFVAVPTDGKAVGNASTPVYVNANGQVVAGNTHITSGEKSFNDADYKNKFVQLAFPYNNNNLSQISVARSTGRHGALVAHGPILAFKNVDTQGYLHVGSVEDYVRIGGGASGKIAWERSLVTSPVDAAVGSTSVPVYVDERGHVCSCTDISAGALDFAKDSNGNWGYIDPATKKVVPFTSQLSINAWQLISTGLLGNGATELAPTQWEFDCSKLAGTRVQFSIHVEKAFVLVYSFSRHGGDTGGAYCSAWMDGEAVGVNAQSGASSSSVWRHSYDAGTHVLEITVIPKANAYMILTLDAIIG